MHAMYSVPLNDFITVYQLYSTPINWENGRCTGLTVVVYSFCKDMYKMILILYIIYHILLVMGHPCDLVWGWGGQQNIICPEGGCVATSLSGGWELGL